MMDPLFLNLGLPQQSSVSATASVGSTSASATQVNGLSQESKLATYISNRSQPQQTTHDQSVTKSVAALSLDGNGQRKISAVIPEFIPSSSTSSGLAHSSSTPSFHSFSGLSSPSLSAAVANITPFTPQAHRSSPATSSPQRPSSPQGSPTRGRQSPLDSSAASNVSTYQENVGGTTYFFTANEMNAGFTAPSPAPAPGSNPQNTMVFPPYHLVPPTPAHVHHLKAPSNAPHFFMADELRHYLLERHAITLAQVDPEQYPDLPTEVDMYHELVPIEAPHSANKSSMFGYATSVYKATNIKTGLHYCLYRIHGYRLNNVKVTQLMDLWKKLQHSSIVQLREVFTSKAFGDNCKMSICLYSDLFQKSKFYHFSEKTFFIIVNVSIYC